MTWLRRLPPLETALVVLAVIVLTGLSLLTQRRSAALNLNSYSSFDADASGYRAWYEVLQREGLRVERLEQPPAYLDSSVAAVIWAPYGGSVSSKGDAQALAAWVSAGGRLVFVGQDAAAQSEPRLGLPQAAEAHALGAVRLAGELRAAGVQRIEWSERPGRWKKLPKHARVLAADAAGPLALRYPLGRGQVFAVIDPAPFANARVGSLDDARFAYYLGAPGSAATVGFDERAHGHLIAAHWWQVLPRALLVALALATLAVLVAIAGAAIRLGPPLVAPRLRDPTSLEFLDSVAALLERGRGGGQALADALASTRRAVASAVGMPEDSPLPELTAALGSDEQRQRFMRLMAAERFTQPDDATLVGIVSLAASLRKEFSTYGSARR